MYILIYLKDQHVSRKLFLKDIFSMNDITDFQFRCNHFSRTITSHFNRLHIRIQIFPHFSMGHTHQLLIYVRLFY